MHPLISFILSSSSFFLSFAFIIIIILPFYSYLISYFFLISLYLYPICLWFLLTFVYFQYIFIIIFIIDEQGCLSFVSLSQIVLKYLLHIFIVSNTLYSLMLNRLLSLILFLLFVLFFIWRLSQSINSL